MMQFTILNSVAELPTPVTHYDSQGFADDSDWYLRFERHVNRTDSMLRIACGRTGDSAEDSSNPGEHDGLAWVVLPLQRTETFTRMSVLSSLDNYYSADYRPLCSDASIIEDIEPLIAYILREENPDVLCLRGLDPDVPETSLVLQALERERWTPYKSVHQVNWVHELTSDFEDYLANRPSRVRSTLKRKTAKLMQLPSVSMAVHEGQQGLSRLLEAYQHIYDRSWKVPEPHSDFVPQLICASAKRGQLRMGLLSIDGQPVAAHFWVVRCGTAFIYKLAHDSAYDQYSPGTVLMGHMIETVIRSDGVTKLDFLNGDDAYKRDWMSVRREKMRVTAYNPNSWRAQACRLRDQHLRSCVKQLWANRPNLQRTL